MLNDKRHIITRDTENNVARYDVLKVAKVEDLGKVDFDEEVNKRNQRVYIPNWFTVDLKTGVSPKQSFLPPYVLSIMYATPLLQMPTIVLGQDEVDCFAAWVSLEAGLPEHVDSSSDLKINYGSLLLQALLEYWTPPNSQNSEYDEIMKGNGYFRIPKHTPVIFSEVGGRTVCRLLARDAAGESESALLHETVPSWVTDVCVERALPKFIKIPFYLLPHPQMAKQDRMKKVNQIRL